MNCLLCGPQDPLGLGLAFAVEPPATVSAAFSCSCSLQSYPGTVHGGIVSAILDAAMTNCLFALGISAVTGELRARFLQPLVPEREARVRASLQRSQRSVHHLEAEIRQDGAVVARATAIFMTKRRRAPEGGEQMRGPAPPPGHAPAGSSALARSASTCAVETPSEPK